MRFPKIAMTVLVLGCCLVSLKANADICTKSIMEHKMMVNITGECTFNEFDTFFTIYKENAFMQWPTKWFLPVVEGKEVPGMTFKIYATELRSDDKPGALGYQIQVRTGKNQGYTYKSKVMARDLKGQTLPEGWTEQRWVQ